MTLGKIIRFIAWGVAGLFGFMGFVVLFIQPLIGLIFLFLGALFVPTIWNATQRYGIWQNLVGRIAAFLVGMAVFVSVAPPPTQPPQAIQPAPIQSAQAPSPLPSPSIVASPSITPSPSISPSPLEPSVSPSPLEQRPVVKQTLTSEPSSTPSPKAQDSPAPAVNPDAPVRDPASGSCDCPYDTDKRGRSCGARSAYSRPGGSSPICYERDRR
jgi:hypothetical protein